MDRLATCVDCSLSCWSKHDELLLDVLLDVPQECGFSGTGSSCKEKAVVGTLDHFVGCSLLVVADVEFCFHFFFCF